MYKDKLFISTILICAISVSIIIVFVIKPKTRMARNLCSLVEAIIIFFSIQVVSNITFSFPTVEEAFQFDYKKINNKRDYKMIYRNDYENTSFIVGRDSIKSDYEVFNCYYNGKMGWRSIVKKSDNSVYDIYYCNNKKDSITGIFITEANVFKGNFEELKIKDTYKTSFEPIKDESGTIIKYDNRGNYIYFGLVEQSIDKDYYVTINGEKVKIM